MKGDTRNDSSMKQPKSLRLRFRTWDRLSTLPDEIICDILSRLPISTAVSTSALSRRWRYLWRGVRRVEYVVDGIVKKKKKKKTATASSLQHHINCDTGLNSIIKQLTCQKLQLFHLDLFLISHHPRRSTPKSALQPCLNLNLITLASVFRQVYDRNVEEFIFAGDHTIYSKLTLPAFLLHSPSLVTLNLFGSFTIKLPENATVCLPNLKHLYLQHLLNLPTWLDPLFRSSPLLESVVLVAQHRPDEDSDSPESLTLFAPSLTSLQIHFRTYDTILKHTNFFIHAPKLSNLDIADNTNVYYFVPDQCPTKLLNARLDLTYRETFALVTSEGYTHHMSMFVRGMYVVTDLDLQVDSSSNIFPALYSANIRDGLCPMFRNITHFRTSWEHIGLDGWTHLLPLLHYFPYLNHLNVEMSDDGLEKEWDFCPPDSVPNCLVSHLKTIHVSAPFRDVGFDLNSLAAYILSHALVLEDLHFSVDFGYLLHAEPLLLKQHHLCRSLFKLPKCSSCNVVFSGASFTASSNTYKYMKGPTSRRMAW